MPDSIREAGFGVGAARWEVTRGHVLPYAAPGILTGTVLALARALGEAAPLILVGRLGRLLRHAPRAPARSTASRARSPHCRTSPTAGPGSRGRTGRPTPAPPSS